MKEYDWQFLRYFFSSLVLLFMVARSCYGVLRIWKNLYKDTCYQLVTTVSFAFRPSSRFNLHVYFRLFCQTPIIQMSSLNRNEKLTCENCGTRRTKLNLVRHKKRCSFGQCIVPNNPILPQNRKMIWITILLRSAAPQNLMSPSSVNFVMKSFQDFTL